MELRSHWPRLWLLAFILLLTQQAQTIPFQQQQSPYLLDLAARAARPETTHDPLAALRKRECANVCGAEKQLCCASGETCTTHPDGSASCSGWPHKILAARQQSGNWQTYTSVWTETNLVTKTSIYSSFVPVATASGGCNYAAQESKCDTRCCPSGYYCYAPGTCAVAGNGGFTTLGVVGTIPARPTTISGVVVTSTVRPSTTLPYQTPVTTGGADGTLVAQASSGGGLSGGAIAGIVIGVLLGIALLFLLCFCCCLQGILSCFGIGKKKKKDRRHTTVVSEDEYIRHRRRGNGLGAALGLGGAGLAGRQWAGRNSRRSRSSSDRYTRSSRRRPPPKKSKWGGGLTALASGAGAAALLGMFNKKKKGRTEKSSSSGSYSYSYTDSSSADSRSRRTSRRGGRYDDRSRRTRSSRSRSRSRR